jgi:hypothetical protein
MGLTLLMDDIHLDQRLNFVHLQWLAVMLPNSLLKVCRSFNFKLLVSFNIDLGAATHLEIGHSFFVTMQLSPTCHLSSELVAGAGSLENSRGEQ